MARQRIDKLSGETEELESSISGIENIPIDDQTRKEVALRFVKYYFLILILIVIGVPVYNLVVAANNYSDAIIIPLKDTVLTYSAVVGPTLGLVIAYYFKSKGD